MGFREQSREEIETVGYITSRTAERVLDYLDPQQHHEYVQVYETASEAYRNVFEEGVYEVSISIKRV